MQEVAGLEAVVVVEEVAVVVAAATAKMPHPHRALEQVENPKVVVSGFGLSLGSTTVWKDQKA